jgi:hypothetical protein
LIVAISREAGVVGPKEDGHEPNPALFRPGNDFGDYPQSKIGVIAAVVTSAFPVASKCGISTLARD